MNERALEQQEKAGLIKEKQRMEVTRKATEKKRNQRAKRKAIEIEEGIRNPDGTLKQLAKKVRKELSDIY
jgi:hypothetical protein